MIELSEPVDISNEFVGLAKLPRANDVFAGNPDCWIAGWGRISEYSVISGTFNTHNYIYTIDVSVFLVKILVSFSASKYMTICQFSDRENHSRVYISLPYHKEALYNIFILCYCPLQTN